MERQVEFLIQIYAKPYILQMTVFFSDACFQKKKLQILHMICISELFVNSSVSDFI